MSNEIETRAVELRADAETGIVEGIAVPWMSPTSIGGRYTEQFERGSIGAGDVKLFWNHSEPIGRVIESEDRDEGHWIRAQISDTTAGRDARTLARDGVVDKFSVGFRPVEHREEEDGTITRTSVDLAEVSMVPFPAYQGAQISSIRSELTEVREDHSTKETEMADNAVSPEDLAEVREGLETLDRRFSTLATPAAPAVADTRSAGEILKGIVAGDETALRAYTGSTTADLGSTLKPTWIGDLTRIVDKASVVRGLFSKGALPSTGMTLEYGQLGVNSSAAGKQANEGDKLPYGKVTVTTKTADVETYGGYSSLSRQAIERGQINLLDLQLRGQAIALGQALNTAFVTTYQSAVTASTQTVSIPNSSDYDAYIAGIVDAVGIFQDNGLSLDYMIVNKTEFVYLTSLKDSTGRPLFLITGDGINNVGSLSAVGLRGDLAGIRVVADASTQMLATSSAFVNSEAIREYSSPVVRLADEDITTLTKDFSVYQYSALATEIPAGIVRVDNV